MRAFQAFTYSRLTPWLITPCLTLARASQPDNLHFPPCGWRVSPIQAASFPSLIGCRREPPDHATWTFSSLPVRHSESRSPVRRRRGAPGQTTLPFQAFCSVRLTRLTQWVLISRRTPARCSRPDNLTFSIPRPARLTHPDCKYLPSVGCRREPHDHATWPFLSLPVRHSKSRSPVGRRWGSPGQTTLPFPSRGRRDLPIQTASIYLPSDVGESLPTTQLDLFRLYLSDTASLDLLSDAGEVLPARQPYLFKPLALWGLPFWHSEYWAPVRRRREPPSQTNLLFRSCGRRGLPNHAACWLPEDHLTLPFCLNLSDLVSPDLPTDAGESTHDQTILPFQVPLSARITRPTPRALISHQTSARASQPDKLIFSVRSYHNIEPPSNATYPIGQAILAFSPPPARLNQTLSFHLHLSDSESWSPVGRGAPGQTTLPFPSRGRRDLPIQTASKTVNVTKMSVCTWDSEPNYRGLKITSERWQHRYVIFAPRLVGLLV